MAHPEKENLFGFYKFEEEEQSQLEKYDRFKDINKQMLDWAVKDKEQLRRLEYSLNDPSKFIDGMPFCKSEDTIELNIAV